MSSDSHCDHTPATDAETFDDDSYMCGCCGSEDCGVIKPPRRGGLNLLGLGSASPKGYGSCDFEQKYAPDTEYTEMGPNAPVWKLYMDVCTPLDEQAFVERNDSLNVVLVFGSLFTLAVAIMVSHTFQLLKPDYDRMMSLLLNEVLDIQLALILGLPVDDVPSADVSLVSAPRTAHLWVNGLWFTSLVLSLMASVSAMTVKKWLREAITIPSGGAPRERARIRQFRFNAFEKWRVQLIIDVLPVVLHLAVGMFVVGLVVFAASLDDVLGIVVAGVCLGGMLVSFVWSCISAFSLRSVFTCFGRGRKPDSDKVPSAELYPDLEKSTAENFAKEAMM